jgi:REP element-mobilizing transposase RayT
MTDSDYHERPYRTHPVHRPALGIDNRSIIIFVTVCTKHRAPLLATPEMHEAILAAWHEASYWLVGRYVILPDHIHLFCAPGVYPATPLQNWIRFWKSRVAHSVDRGSDVLWQKNFWDVQLRHGDSYSAKWDYVRNNPVRHQLSPTAAAWAFQGELNLLRWHK